MNSKPQDSRSARSLPLLLRSLGCLGSASLLTSSFLLNGLALAQEDPSAPPLGAASEVEPALPAPTLSAPVINLAPQDLPPSGQTSVESVFDEPLADYAPRLDIKPTEGLSSYIDDSSLYSTGATDSADVYATDQDLLENPAPAVANEAVQSAPNLAHDSSTVVTNSPSDQDTPLTADAAKAAFPRSGPTGNTAPTNVTASQAGRIRAAVGLPSPSAAATTQLAGRTGSSNGYSITYPSQNPLSMAVQHLGQTIIPSLDVAHYYARSQRPSSLRGNGDRQLLFPLAVPAPISSVFGWRSHPIFGEYRFHSGTDIAAEQGTPIVATLSGKASIADFLGGYGLTVVLDHADGQHQTLYGHMSEIFVKPGQMVRQGEVIGRVGSTGNSTGPHLHFEVRRLTSQGWIAIDPGRYLEGSIAQLMQLLREDPMQPIALAPAPFVLAQSQLGGLFEQQPTQMPIKLSTGLQPLLQPSQQAQTFKPATPLEAKVVEVFQALEGRPATRPTVGAAGQSLGAPVSYQAEPSPRSPQLVSRGSASERDEVQ